MNKKLWKIVSFVSERYRRRTRRVASGERDTDTI